MGLVHNTEIYSSTKPWGSEFILKITLLYIVKLVEITANKSIPRHTHEEKEETWVVTVGNGSANINNEKIKIMSGNTIHVPSGQLHMISAGPLGLTIIMISTPEMWEN
jgi:quercetin dioxygenase-like cupin family protein